MRLQAGPRARVRASSRGLEERAQHRAELLVGLERELPLDRVGEQVRHAAGADARVGVAHDLAKEVASTRNGQRGGSMGVVP